MNGRYLQSANNSDQLWSDNIYSNSNRSYSTLNLLLLNHVTNIGKTFKAEYVLIFHSQIFINLLTQLLDNKSDIKFINMDILTVVWYFSTFLVLVAFFAVMACSDSHCGRTRKPEIPALTPPPTPAPSYREFAPPSYDSVANGIFIISLNEKTNTIETPSDVISAPPPNNSGLSDIFVQRV